MALTRLSKGDAIDMDLVNKLIDNINKLEAANNFQAIYNFQGTKSSMTSTLLLQAGAFLVPGNGQSRVQTHVTYPVPFINHAMVVPSAHAPGDISAAYIATVFEAEFSRFTVNIERKDGMPLNAPISLHWHALGPVNASTIV